MRVYQQKEQYQISKETIDLINRKCHDLKHQVRAMRTIEGEKERDAYLKEIEQSVHMILHRLPFGSPTRRLLTAVS